MIVWLGIAVHLQVEQGRYRDVLRDILSPENQPRKALRHLNVLGIVISYADLYKVITLKLMKISEKRQYSNFYHQSNESVNIEMIAISTNINKSEPSRKTAETLIEKTIKV